jgi:arginine:pyruvate transaminase
MRFAAISDRLTGLGGAKWAVHREGRRRFLAGEPVIMLSIGEPDLPPPTAVVEQAVTSLRGGRTRYTDGRGDQHTLQAVADHLTRRSGLAVSTDNILCVAGTQNGLFTAMLTLAEMGDEVIVPDPYYATYEAVVAASGARFVAVPTLPESRFHLTAEALEAAITPRSRVLLLNSPSNPTGAVLSADEIEAIGAVCEQHDLWIIADEVYADISFTGSFASPFDHPRFRSRTVSVASISKSHALPGFRSGWLAAPAELIERATLVAEVALFGAQPFLADALAIALNDEHAEVAALRDTFETRARTLVNAFAGSDAATARMPEGGMFVMVDIRRTGLTGEQFAWKLLDEHQVVVMPGESFGTGGAGHLRIALTVDSVVLEDACHRIRTLADSLTT